MENESWAKKGTAVLMNTYARFPLALVRGEGTRVWDAEGRVYLDFVAGVAVNALGHCHPRVVAALKEQAETLLHCSNLYHIPPQVELAARLAELFGGGKVFFANSGAEANEAAIKLARKYFFRRGEARYEIIAAENSFHGRTLGALAATGQEVFHEGFGPLPAGFKFVPLNDLEAFKKALSSETAAVILEAIQGEGGIYPATEEYLQGVASLCKEKRVLLIFDEVQCGFGRTGEFFAYAHAGVKPDIVTLGKALGGGIPLAAVMARDEVAAAFQPGDHGCTFGGNPFACRAGIAALKTLFEEGLLLNAKKQGEYLKEGLEKLASRYPNVVKEVRGRGLMLGVELKVPKKPVLEACLKRGLLLGSAGHGKEILRLLPPLTVKKEEIDEALGILEEAFSEVSEGEGKSGE